MTPSLWKSPKRLYLNDDKSEVVEEGDPRAAFLLVIEGGELAIADAQRYGLVERFAPDESQPEAKPKGKKAVEGPPATKAISEPPATK